MKIKTVNAPLDKVLAKNPPKHKPPRRPNLFFRTLLKLASVSDLRDADFTYTQEIERAGSGPFLILMNHSSFIDLEIAETIFYPDPLAIVCTSDGFVGKEWLMRQLGCIPTQKFVSDYTLLRDINFALHKKKCSVLMYPEASYSFDGCATPLPRKLGYCLKKLDVPVLFIKTEGAFLRDPLYNCLQKRKVKVSAHVSCLLTREEIREKSVPELDAILDTAFSFDAFRSQRENGIRVSEPFRADGLERILYKCPCCCAEGVTEGKGTEFVCRSCGARWEFDEFGVLKPLNGNGGFDHIPDWYAWEREEVRKELEAGSYLLSCPVKIGIMADYKAIYMVGEGQLRHTADGFLLEGCQGALRYEQSPLVSYGLYADYYWYELGDVICIGDRHRLYYCFPSENIPVAKARLATEELYKIRRSDLSRKA